MEVAENIVFKCSRTHYADEFTISYGEAIFLFAPPPMNMLDKEAYFVRLMKGCLIKQNTLGMWRIIRIYVAVNQCRNGFRVSRS